MDEFTAQDCNVSLFGDTYNTKAIVEPIVLSLVDGILIESAGNSQNKLCLKDNESIYQMEDVTSLNSNENCGEELENKPDHTKMDQIKLDFTELNKIGDGSDSLKKPDDNNSNLVKKLNVEQVYNDEILNSDERNDQGNKLKNCQIDKKESVQFCSPIAVYYQYNVVSQTSSQDTEILSSDDDSEHSQTDAPKIVTDDAKSEDDIDKNAIDSTCTLVSETVDLNKKLSSEHLEQNLNIENNAPQDVFIEVSRATVLNECEAIPNSPELKEDEISKEVNELIEESLKESDAVGNCLTQNQYENENDLGQNIEKDFEPTETYIELSLANNDANSSDDNLDRSVLATVLVSEAVDQVENLSSENPEHLNQDIEKNASQGSDIELSSAKEFNREEVISNSQKANKVKVGRKLNEIIAESISCTDSAANSSPELNSQHGSETDLFANDDKCVPCLDDAKSEDVDVGRNVIASKIEPETVDSVEKIANENPIENKTPKDTDIKLPSATILCGDEVITTSQNAQEIDIGKPINEIHVTSATCANRSNDLKLTLQCKLDCVQIDMEKDKAEENLTEDDIIKQNEKETMSKITIEKETECQTPNDKNEESDIPEVKLESSQDLFQDSYKDSDHSITTASGLNSDEDLFSSTESVTSAELSDKPSQNTETMSSTTDSRMVTEINENRRKQRECPSSDLYLMTPGGDSYNDSILKGRKLSLKEDNFMPSKNIVVANVSADTIDLSSGMGSIKNNTETDKEIKSKGSENEVKVAKSSRNISESTEEKETNQRSNKFDDSEMKQDLPYHKTISLTKNHIFESKEVFTKVSIQSHEEEEEILNTSSELHFEEKVNANYEVTESMTTENDETCCIYIDKISPKTLINENGVENEKDCELNNFMSEKNDYITKTDEQSLINENSNENECLNSSNDITSSQDLFQGTDNDSSTPESDLNSNEDLFNSTDCETSGESSDKPSQNAENTSSVPGLFKYVVSVNKGLKADFKLLINKKGEVCLETESANDVNKRQNSSPNVDECTAKRQKVDDVIQEDKRTVKRIFKSTINEEQNECPVDAKVPKLKDIHACIDLKNPKMLKCIIAEKLASMEEKVIWKCQVINASENTTENEDTSELNSTEIHQNDPFNATNSTNQIDSNDKVENVCACKLEEINPDIPVVCVDDLDIQIGERETDVHETTMEIGVDANLNEKYDNNSSASLPAKVNITNSPGFITATEFASQTSNSQSSSTGFIVVDSTDLLNDRSSQESSKSTPVVGLECLSEPKVLLQYEITEDGVSEETFPNQVHKGVWISELGKNDQDIVTTNIREDEQQVNRVDELDVLVDNAIDQLVPDDTDSSGDVHMDVEDNGESLYTQDHESKAKQYACDVDMCDEKDDPVCRLLDKTEKSSPDSSGYKQCFRWKYAPSCDLDTPTTLPDLADEDSMVRIMPIKTCSKPIRMGLSRKQPIKSLHNMKTQQKHF